MTFSESQDFNIDDLDLGDFDQFEGIDVFKPEQLVNEELGEKSPEKDTGFKFNDFENVIQGHQNNAVATNISMNLKSTNGD